MPILIIALVLALASGGGVVYAAQDAAPGDALHGVKTLAERVEQVPQAAAVGLSRVLDRAGTKEAKGKGHKSEVESNDEISGTVTLSDTHSITDTNWYSHTVAAFSGITGTLGLTFTDTLSDVIGLADDDNVPGQSFKGLAAKLRAVAESLKRGKSQVAVHQLDAFLNKLNAMERSGHISEDNFEELLADYNTLVAGLETAVQAVGLGPRADKANKGHGGKGLDDDDEITTTITSTLTSGVGSGGGKGKPAGISKGRGRR